MSRSASPETGKLENVLGQPVGKNGKKVLVARINRDMGITVIMISHDVREAIPYATHILHMDKDYFFGTAEAYRESEYGRLFLG